MPSSLNRDLRAIQNVIQSTVPAVNMKPGTVIAVLPTGAQVRIAGSNNTQNCDTLKGTTLEIGDEVFVFRVEGGQRWTVFGVSRGATIPSSSGTAPSSSALACPANFTVYGGWGFILARWDTLAQRSDLSYQVEVANLTDEIDAKYYTASGQIHIEIADPGVSKRFRVRSVDEDLNKSAWTDWKTGTADNLWFTTGLEVNLPGVTTVPEGEPYFAYDTSTLWVCHNGAWIKAAGGAAETPGDPGTGPGSWSVDTVPASPSAYDNEFTDNLTNWTEYDPLNAATVSLVDGKAKIQINSAASTIMSIYRAIPSDVPWTIWTKFQLFPEDKADIDYPAFAGVWVRDTLPAQDAVLTHLISIYNWVESAVPNRAVLCSDMYGLSGGASSPFTHLVDGTGATGWKYIRIRWTGVGQNGASTGQGKIHLDASLDGLYWIPAETVTYTSIPANFYIGLGVWEQMVNDPFCSAEFEFFRYKASFAGATDPVEGQWIGTNISSEANEAGDVVYFDYQITSPLKLGDVADGDHYHSCMVVIDTPFNGSGHSLSVGDTGDNSRLFANTDVDVTEAGQYLVQPEYEYQSAATLNLYLTPGTATAGAGRIILTHKEAYG